MIVLTAGRAFWPAEGVPAWNGPAYPMLLVSLVAVAMLLIVREQERRCCPLCGGRRWHSRSCPQRDRDA